jgi:hypothetical protein
MELTINETNENFETWLNKEFITSELKELLIQKSILLIPFENLRDTPNPFLFPVGTENILRYFKENLPENQSIDICITDENYQEFAFYSDYKRLGNFLVKSVAIAVFVNVFSAYVYNQYIKEDHTKPQIQIIDNSTNTTINNHISNLTDKKYLEPTHIKFSVTVVDSLGKSKNISYEGPASEIDSVLKSVKEYGE